MATVPGFGAGFDASNFRAAIHNVMQMAAPNSVSDQVTFFFDGTSEWASTDEGGSPWDWGATPVSATPVQSFTVDCAVEFISRTTLAAGTAVADHDTPRAVLTLLDEDWENVEGFDYCTLSGNTYETKYVRPKIALFDVDVIQVEVVAVDES